MIASGFSIRQRKRELAVECGGGTKLARVGGLRGSNTAPHSTKLGGGVDAGLDLLLPSGIEAGESTVSEGSASDGWAFVLFGGTGEAGRHFARGG